MSFADVKESQREPPPKAHHYYWYGNKVRQTWLQLVCIKCNHGDLL